MAMRYHPDIYSGDDKKFLEIKRAYELLMDPAQRHKIDIQILNENNLIDFKNNVFSYHQLILILNQLDIEIKKYNSSNYNKELLGEYLLWLWDNNRIYHILQSHPDSDLQILVDKTILLSQTTSENQQIELLKHLLHLNEIYNKKFIDFVTTNIKINKLNNLNVYNKYKVLILIMSSILICFIIFFTSK